MKPYIGIDPGTAGGICLLLDGVPTEYTAMPPTAKEVKEWLEMAQMCSAAHTGVIEIPMIVEHQQPMVGRGKVNVNCTATMMRKYGQWEIFALMLGFPFHQIRPHVWKKDMGLNSDKKRSIELCQQLFPTVNLIPPRHRNPHDGVAEAILIAEYARRKGL